MQGVASQYMGGLCVHGMYLGGLCVHGLCVVLCL